MTIPKVCITEMEYDKGREVFEAAEDFSFVPVKPQETAIVEAIRRHEAGAVVVGIDRYIGPLYAALPSGGVIARFGVGCDGLDHQMATAHKLFIVNTPGALNESVAELAIGMICAVSRDIPRHHEYSKSAVWHPCTGQEISGKTLLIVGCGKIGCRVARIASFGFDMRVLGYDISPLDETMLQKSYGIEWIADLDEAVAQADFVSLHIPSLASTKHFVDAEFLAKMKSEAYLINTSRGSIIDESALFDALISSRIAGAALDVYETEPYLPGHSSKDLRQLKNILLTPHIGSSTNQANLRMARQVLSNLRNAASERYEQMDIVNKRVLSRLKTSAATPEKSFVRP